MIATTLSLTRRNHALEHATLQVLSAKNPGLRMAGYSTPHGFWVLGNVDISVLAQAVEEAQHRLRAGERRLAVHPYCGTNFVLPGLAGGAVAWLAMLGSGRKLRDKIDRLPLVTTLVTLALMLTFPLGPKLQERYTIDPELGDLQVVRIDRYVQQGTPAHFVSTGANHAD